MSAHDTRRQRRRSSSPRSYLEAMEDGDGDIAAEREAELQARARRREAAGGFDGALFADDDDYGGGERRRRRAGKPPRGARSRQRRDRQERSPGRRSGDGRRPPTSSPRGDSGKRDESALYGRSERTRAGKGGDEDSDLVRRRRAAEASTTDRMPATMAGYLHKRKRHHRRFTPDWNKRWFTIEGKELRYYSSSSASLPSGMVLFRRLRLVRHLKEEDGRRGCRFQVYGADRTFELRAKSSSEADKWVRQIQLQMDVWKTEAKPLKKRESSLDAAMQTISRTLKELPKAEADGGLHEDSKRAPRPDAPETRDSFSSRGEEDEDDGRRSHLSSRGSSRGWSEDERGSDGASLDGDRRASGASGASAASVSSSGGWLGGELVSEAVDVCEPHAVDGVDDIVDDVVDDYDYGYDGDDHGDHAYRRTRSPSPLRRDGDAVGDDGDGDDDDGDDDDDDWPSRRRRRRLVDDSPSPLRRRPRSASPSPSPPRRPAIGRSTARAAGRAAEEEEARERRGGRGGDLGGKSRRRPPPPPPSSGRPAPSSGRMRLAGGGRRRVA
eukprot:PLAT13867.1.p1 GENE.PLAT13867.1~~PLAT13867.1.p1  ORF type:complete len:554 (-),score=142.55 PLAT13867.1:84-1745(-)